MTEKSDIPQGALDLLILKIVASARSTDTRLRNDCNRSHAM